MKAKLAILFMAALTLGPLAGAVPTYFAPGNPNCVNADSVHSYGPFIGFFTESKTADTGTFGVGGASGSDGNLADCPGTTSDPADYDGDTEYGYGGTFHPAGAYVSCAGEAGDSSLAATAHHPSGPGAQYQAEDAAGSVFFSAGTDGPVSLDPALLCVTNSITSDDPITDPADCPGDIGATNPGPTQVGSYPMWSTIGAASHGALVHGEGPGDNRASDGGVDPTHNLLHNDMTTASASECDPYDGFVVVFLIPGVFESDGNVYVSAPTLGDVRHK